MCENYENIYDIEIDLTNDGDGLLNFAYGEDEEMEPNKQHTEMGNKYG
ncbi:MAG TPA: hypothetical protein PKA28_03195 [Methylomusa anaerophila]|uniref:Uncharacterized protein n=1 Tax=Methylomusa anaerophila TaxID=1930071 RepID=A0A348ANR8_9FIRM|nr:hypothetical protein [Methylomusa anaerophila]BBB92716.1 hypothetical protein MAMMFC1_03411 [Methylomusa anaerophila]HML87431.1 hypothetical protein [Methylomusa anaerophila]